MSAESVASPAQVFRAEAKPDCTWKTTTMDFRILINWITHRNDLCCQSAAGLMKRSSYKEVGQIQGGKVMNEYSRIVIEQYCGTHSKTKKSSFLQKLLKGSYSLDYEPGDWEALQLSQYIESEKDPELRAALEDLDEYLFR
ncbi:MAG: hypothetical protein QM270_04090 [Bacillota bacterium]|nr:hypothetical protein [Bacillota bacterium]